MFCSVCGTQNRKDVAYCKQCGTSLMGEADGANRSLQLAQFQQDRQPQHAQQSLQPQHYGSAQTENSMFYNNSAANAKNNYAQAQCQQQRQQPHSHMQQSTVRESYFDDFSQEHRRQNKVVAIPPVLEMVCSFFIIGAFVLALFAAILSVISISNIVEFKSAMTHITSSSGSAISNIAKSLLF